MMFMKLLGASVLGLSLMTGAAHAAGMMIIHHKVANYAKWRPVFNADKPDQKAAGLTDPRVYQAVGDPNDLTITFDMADPARAKAFATAPKLKLVMKNAGVIGKPEISYLAPAP